MNKETQPHRLMTLAALDFQTDPEFDDMGLTQKTFEILKVGEFYDPRYGKFQVTEERLISLKENFDKNVLDIDVAIDLNHDPAQGAFAWINTLTVEDGKLLMTLKDITSEGRKILKEKVFKYFSVEFAPFETVIDGEKATINDVLRGVAWTNRPVIKGMEPTFLSEDLSNSLNSTNTMSLILKLAENMLTREAVSKADATFLRGQFDESAEEEKTEEVEAKVAEVEAKAVEVEAEADEAGEETPEAPAEEAVEAPEAGEEKEEEEAVEPEALEASEMPAKFAEMSAQLSELQSYKAEKIAEERVSSLTLSEENKVGFTKDSTKDLNGFIATLSEGQFNDFKGLISKVVNTTGLSEELGSSEAGDAGEADSEDAKLEKAQSLAETYEKEGLNSGDAMQKAQKEVGLGK